MKGRMKRAVSGFLTAVTLISTVFQPVNIYAAERDAAKEKPPLYEEVKDQLDEDEVVTAHDLEIGVGYSLDVKADFSGIKIADRKKVKVTFEEAFNEQEKHLLQTMRILIRQFTMWSRRKQTIQNIRSAEN